MVTRQLFSMTSRNLALSVQKMAAAQTESRGSPPPSYDEAMRDRRPESPPPVYNEGAETRARSQPQDAIQNRNNRVAPMITNQEGVILCQPYQEGQVITSQPRNTRSSPPIKKKCTCNCFCASCKCRPRSCDWDCVCYNCVGFVLYSVFCLPAVLCCFMCRRICPETFGDCQNRDSDWKDSYDERHSNPCSLCCWSFVGPCCCYSCDEPTEVCPCAEPCTQRFAILSSLRKMTCYCGSRKACDCSLNIMDEGSFGFICDVRDCGCYYKEENC